MIDIWNNTFSFLKDIFEVWSNLDISGKADILKVLIPTVGIAISTLGTVLIFNKNRKKEINFKIHEQRKDKYEEYLKLIKKVFANAKGIGKNKLPFKEEEWLNAQFGLLLYASDKVIDKANAIRNVNQNDNTYTVLFELGSMILLMRKEIGLENKDLTIRECLSAFINDINDKKYDEFYNNYIKKQRWYYQILNKFIKKNSSK